MAEISTQAQTADDFCEDCGYEPELKRTLGSFQMFAVSFAFISVAVGIFGTYDDVLLNAGPVGIWLWVIVAIGQTLVALVIAQFAARIPLSGSSYQWGSRLANPKIGWGFGWLTFCFSGDRRGGRRQCAGEPGTHAAVGHGAERGHRAGDHRGGAAHPGRPRGGFDPHRRHDQLSAVGLELALVMVLAIALIVAVAITGMGRSTTSPHAVSPRTPRTTSPSAVG